MASHLCKNAKNDESKKTIQFLDLGGHTTDKWSFRSTDERN